MPPKKNNNMQQMQVELNKKYHEIVWVCYLICQMKKCQSSNCAVHFEIDSKCNKIIGVMLILLGGTNMLIIRVSCNTWKEVYYC